MLTASNNGQVYKLKNRKLFLSRNNFKHLMFARFKLTEIIHIGRMIFSCL